MFVFTLFFAALISIATTYNNICDFLVGYENEYNITTSLNFPWTHQTQSCNGMITPMNGHYIAITINATHMGSGKRKEEDYIAVRVDHPCVVTRYYFETHGSQTDTTNLYLAIPCTFELVIIATEKTPSQMQLYVDIKLYENPIGKNIARNVKLEENGPTEVLYFEDIVENATYMFTSNTVVKMHDAYAGKYMDYYSLASLANCWIFSNKTFITIPYLLDSYDVSQLITAHPSDLELICIEKPIYTAAFVFYDYTNTLQFYSSGFTFPPINEPTLTDMYAIGGNTEGRTWGCVTFVGKKDGSTPFDIRQIIPDYPNATFSYSPGGPKDHPNGTVIRKPPVHITGNLNTLYSNYGNIQFKVTVSN